VIPDPLEDIAGSIGIIHDAGVTSRAPAARASVPLHRRVC
jgi:hypothetical protein